jgi:chloramphenicol 3-O phosphotransferase
LLLGPSSVGKTETAKELQRSLHGPWLIAGVDMFWGMLDERTLAVGDFRSDSHVMRQITRGWHRAVVAMVREGNDVIVDELWIHGWWLDDWREILAGVRWWSVLLRASSSVLSAREGRRSDRPPGLAASDLAHMPDDGSFDLVIDTDRRSVAECAAAILDLIDGSDRAAHAAPR